MSHEHTTAIDHHDEMAAHALACADLYRGYLGWSEDPDRVAWAAAKADAAEADAAAEQKFADALRARTSVTA